MQIGVLSDTHSYLDERIIHHLSDCQEIWHAGDTGDPAIISRLAKITLTRGVYGNIDNAAVRQLWPKTLLFNAAGKKIMMTHIAGTPGKYYPEVRNTILREKPDILVCGHSHILRVQYDKRFRILYINPGAAGRHGFHKVRTMIKFNIEAGKISNMRVIELGHRGRLSEPVEALE